MNDLILFNLYYLLCGATVSLTNEVGLILQHLVQEYFVILFNCVKILDFPIVFEICLYKIAAPKWGSRFSAINS